MTPNKSFAGMSAESLGRMARELCDGCRLSWQRDKTGRHAPPADGILCEAPDIRAELKRRAATKEPT